ncbi:MAG: diguanylate cyclase [Gammaproteobacteria bacterium]|nr:diguanylate cyclase [Gammaproteobacteria bacterium]MDH5651593.1 diguanylate cyclase [Gammaproteobacteria bacterium]
MPSFFLSYRVRLVVYSSLLILFLITITVYSYHYVHKLIRTEVDEHIRRIADISHTRIKDMHLALQGYTEIVRDDLRLQEYMFVVTAIGSEKQPLQELFQRHFAWIPTDRKMIIADNGTLLVGKQDKVFLQKITHLLRADAPQTVYIEADDGLELVSMAPISYRDSSLGKVIVTRRLGKQWLETQHKDTGVMSFYEKDGRIVASCSSSLLNTKMDITTTKLISSTDSYHTYQLVLPNTTTDMPRLWFALKDTDINARLNQHQRTILVLVITGIAAISLFGLLLIRNFTKPLTQLMNMTREIAAGKLPQQEITYAHGEIAALANQFADMVKALAEQQREIEQVHAALEKSAITDMLTGLYNRRYLQVIFPKLIAQAKRDNSHLAAILIDIDHFKRINDTHGHVAGDLCLAHFSDELKKHSRANDYLFRIGGEEFLILAIADEISGMQNYAEKLRQSIESTPASHNQQLIHFTISCGVSFDTPLSLEGDTLTHILSRADRALYKAKEKGRNQVQIDEDSVALLRTLPGTISSH